MKKGHIAFSSSDSESDNIPYLKACHDGISSSDEHEEEEIGWGSKSTKATTIENETEYNPLSKHAPPSIKPCDIVVNNSLHRKNQATIPAPPLYINFTLSRKAGALTVYGRQFNYTFFGLGDAQHPMFHVGPVLKKQIGIIPIRFGVGFNMGFTLLLMADKDRSHFYLKRDDQTGPELLNIVVSRDLSGQNGPCSVCVHVHGLEKLDKIVLRSKLPHLTPDGRWVLNFNKRFALKSSKNCILTTEKDGRTIDQLFIRKITKNDLEMDAVPQLHPLVIFTTVFCLCLGRR